jgi:hypothetical protein
MGMWISEKRLVAIGEANFDQNWGSKVKLLMAHHMTSTLHAGCWNEMRGREAPK